MLTDTCSEGKQALFKQFGIRASECSDSYWVGNEDTRSYNGSWTKPLSKTPKKTTEYTYQSSWKLNTIPTTGKLASYSGSGYVLTMPGDHNLHQGWFWHNLQALRNFCIIRYKDWLKWCTHVQEWSNNYGMALWHLLENLPLFDHSYISFFLNPLLTGIASKPSY